MRRIPDRVKAMLDSVLARLFGSALDAVGRRMGSGWALAIIAFVLSLAAVPLISWHYALEGGALFVVGRILAAVASRGGDGHPALAVLDAVSFAAVPFAFALADRPLALAAALLIFALVAQATAAMRFGRGLIADTELVIGFAVACVFPAYFPIVAYILAVLCFVSAGVQLATPRRLS